MEISGVLSQIRNDAQTEIGVLQDAIDVHQVEINDLKEEQKKLRAVVKAASDKPLNLSSHKQKKSTGIREVTRKKVISLIKSLGSEEFTIPALTYKAAHGDNELRDLAESTITRAINVLREEGIVRQIGVEGRAPVYRWVGQ